MLFLALKRLGWMVTQDAAPQQTVFCKGTVMTLQAQYQAVHVKRGTAWITLNGEDHVLYEGDEIILVPAGDQQVTISGLGNKRMVISVQRGGRHG